MSAYFCAQLPPRHVILRSVAPSSLIEAQPCAAEQQPLGLYREARDGCARPTCNQHHHSQRKPLAKSPSEKRPTLNVQRARNSLSRWPTRVAAAANPRSDRFPRLHPLDQRGRWPLAKSLRRPPSPRRLARQPLASPSHRKRHSTSNLRE